MIVFIVCNPHPKHKLITSYLVMRTCGTSVTNCDWNYIRNYYSTQHMSSEVWIKHHRWSLPQLVLHQSFWNCVLLGKALIQQAKPVHETSATRIRTPCTLNGCWSDSTVAETKNAFNLDFLTLWLQYPGWSPFLCILPPCFFPWNKIWDLCSS